MWGHPGHTQARTDVVFKPPADPREVVPHEVDAELVDGLDGVRDVPYGLGHLGAVYGPVRVREQVSRLREVEYLQHCWEVDCVKSAATR